MKTTRKNNFDRILVVVLDCKLIPTQLDTVIGAHYFELKFTVERLGFDENGDEVEMDFSHGEDKGNGDIDKDNVHEDQDAARDPKRSRCDDMIMEDMTNSSKDNGAANKQSLEGDANIHAVECGVPSEAEIQRLANEIIDGVVMKTLDFCCDKVLAESDKDLMDGALEDVLSEEEDDLFGAVVNDSQRKGVSVVAEDSNLPPSVMHIEVATQEVQVVGNSALLDSSSAGRITPLEVDDLAEFKKLGLQMGGREELGQLMRM